MKIERRMKHRKNTRSLVWYVLKQKFVMKSQIQKRRHILFKKNKRQRSKPAFDEFNFYSGKKKIRKKKARSSRPGTTVKLTHNQNKVKSQGSIGCEKIKCGLSITHLYHIKIKAYKATCKLVNMFIKYFSMALKQRFTPW